MNPLFFTYVIAFALSMCCLVIKTIIAKVKQLEERITSLEKQKS